MKRILLSLAMIIFASAAVQAQKASTAGKKYAAVISFNSFGTGTPSEKPLKQYIKRFKKTNKIKSITADKMGPFGREGEYKLGFMLTELNIKQKRKFVSGLQSVVAAMKDKGSAELSVNLKVNVKEINERATTEVVVY